MRTRLPRRATFCALCAAALAACATADHPAASSADPRQAYLLGVIDRLPNANAGDIDRAPREELYLWGSEICSQLRAGKPEKQATSDLAEYFGPALGSALVGSAKEVICPELAGAKRTAL